MDSTRIKRIVTILLLTCAAAVVVYLLTDGDSFDGATLTIVNKSRETIDELTASIEEGAAFAQGELADGARAEVELEGVEGESLVWISYRRPDGSVVEGTGAYIENSAAYAVTMIVQPDGGVLVEMDLEYY